MCLAISSCDLYLMHIYQLIFLQGNIVKRVTVILNVKKYTIQFQGIVKPYLTLTQKSLLQVKMPFT